ncbi:MAG: pirin family protein, partial [Promethearchaeota archaeon]
FGTLRVFNDDTLSPGAIWPLHPHRRNEVVTYIVEGEFRHADENGLGGILKEGWVQHTTIGKGMYHSEINNSQDQPMRFIQIWFYPEKPDLDPAVKQKEVEKIQRMNIIYPLVSNEHNGALPIRSNAQVHSSFLENNKTVEYLLKDNRGVYLCVLKGGSIQINGISVPEFGAAKILDEVDLKITAQADSELLLVDVSLQENYVGNY